MQSTEASELLELAKTALLYAKKNSAQEASVIISCDQGESLSWREKDVEELNREGNFSFAVKVMNDKKAYGIASTSDRSKAAIEQAVDAAIAIARESEGDEANGLPDKNQYQTQEKIAEFKQKFPDIARDFGDFANTQGMKNLARELESQAEKFDARINNIEASVYNNRNLRLYADSNDFFYQRTTSSCGYGLSLLATDNSSHNQQSASYFKSQTNPELLPNPRTIAEKASLRALNALNPQPIKNAKYPVLFVPEVASSLISHLLSALSGTMQYRKLSFLNDALGSQVLPEFLSLKENPYQKNSMFATPCDDEGLPPAESEIIENGVVKRYLLSLYSARRLNLAPTGNAGGVVNLHFSTPNENLPSRKEILKNAGDALMITSLMGQGVNLLTGDYSRGASGFLMRNGEIVQAVEGLTVAGNLRDILKNISAIADDADINRNAQIPSMLINGITIAN